MYICDPPEILENMKHSTKWKKKKSMFLLLVQKTHDKKFFEKSG